MLSQLQRPMTSLCVLVMFLCAQPLLFADSQSIFKPLSIADTTYCQDLGAFIANGEICTSSSRGCGMERSSTTSPCSQGNGVCTASTGVCGSCAQTAPGYASYVSTNSDCRVNTKVVFQAQPFLVVNINSDEAEIILPMFGKTEIVDWQQLHLNSVDDSLIGNDIFSESVDRSLPTDAQFTAAFTTNRYFSVFVLDALDCASTSQLLPYNGFLVPKFNVSMRGGMGLVLWNTTKSDRPFYPIDPLGAIDPELDSKDDYLTHSNNNGAINFTADFAQFTRYSNGLQDITLGSSRFTGSGASIALHTMNKTRTVNSLSTSVAVSTTIPVALEVVLGLPSLDVSSPSVSVFQDIQTQSRNASSSILFGGTATRTFTTSIGESRFFSSVLLHKGWNVFAAGSQNRSASYFISPMISASKSTGTNVMLPFTIFSNDSERQQVLNRVGSPLSDYYFELVYPIRIEILPKVAKVLYWSDQTFDVLPLPYSNGISYAAAPSAFSSAGSAQVFYAFAEFFNSTKNGKIASFEQMSGSWVSVVYIPGTPTVMFVGNNNYGQFGFGAAEIGQEFPKFFSGATPVSNIAFSLQNESDIAQVVVGETQLLVRSGGGRLFFCGRAPIRSPVGCRANTTAEIDIIAFEELRLSDPTHQVHIVIARSLASKYGTVVIRSLRVLSVAAGYLYSGLLVQAEITHATLGELSTKHMIVCGGSYITGAADGAVTDLSFPTAATSATFPLDSMLFDTLQSGRFHFCATGPSSPSNTAKLTVACLGTIDTVTGGEASFANETQPLWSTRSYIGAPLQPNFTIRNTSALSFGFHHVVAVVQDGDVAQSPVGNASQREFHTVLASGSNRYGQLGAALNSAAAAPNHVVNPMFSFPEVVASARSPNAYIAANKLPPDQATPEMNYQLFETVSAQALFNSTYVFQRSRVFNTPRQFMANYSATLHRPPPDGKYSLTTIFADSVPELNPFVRGGNFLERVQNISGRFDSAVNVTDLVWDVRFNLVKGLALFLVQTQTTGTGRWYVPRIVGAGDSDITPTAQRDCTLTNRSGFLMGSVTQSTGLYGKGSFYRDWSILRRNISHPPSYRRINATHALTEAITTVMIPSVFFVTSNGSVYPKSRLEQRVSSTGTNVYWFDPVMRTILCNWNEPSTDGSGLTQLLSESTVESISMFVSVEAVNVTLWQAYNITNASSTATNTTTANATSMSYSTLVTIANVSNSSVEMDRRIGALLGNDRLSQRDDYFLCKPIFSIYDCSSLVFYEPFYSVRKSASSFLSFAKGGLHFDEVSLGGKSGLLRLSLSNSWRRLDNVCVFVKLGQLYYFIQLLGVATADEGSVRLCNGTVVPNILRWRSVGSAENQILLQTFDTNNTIVPSSFYTTVSNSNLNPSNVTMVICSHGAVAIGVNGQREPTAYMVFSNETTSALIQEQNGASPATGVMNSADGSFIAHDASYGVYQMPVVPAVAEYNIFVMWIQPEGYVSRFDSLVLRIRNKGDEVRGSGIQFSIGANGTTLEFVDMWQRAGSASAQFYQSQCVTVATAAAVLNSFIIDGSKFYCRPYPLSITSWTRITLQQDASVPSVLSVYMDSEIVARGKHNSIAALFRDVVSIELTMRNRFRPFTTPIMVREVAFCLDSIGIGKTNGRNPFPCSVTSKVLNRFHISTTQSFSNSESQTSEFSSSRSTSETNDVTASRSGSSTLSVSISSSTSITPSEEVSETKTFSNETISTTLRATISPTRTHTIVKNVSVIPINLNTPSLSAYNIRKTGVPILLYMKEDEFHPTQDWFESPNAYMQCNSNVPVTSNPSGFCVSFAKKGFASGFRSPSNHSLLQVTFGPAVFYNSFQDENVVLSFLSSAAASEFRVRGAINFTVIGAGYRITRTLRTIEASGALFALASLGLGGPVSNVMRIATNSIFLNFHCFNDENYPLSWLVSPTNVEVQGSEKLGVAVVTFTVMLAIAGTHFGMVLFVYLRKRDTFLKAQGDVYFPGLTVGICVILLPGYISGAWQGAVESSSAGYVVLVVVTTIAIVSAPMLFLIRTLYDTAYFTAKFVPFLGEVWASFTVKFPVMSRVIPNGVWHSTDRHYSFVRRFHHIIWEFRDTMQHWFCVEFAEGVLVGSVGALTNSNPVVCMAQLACFIAVKVCIFVALIKLRPHSTPFGQWPATVVSMIQLVSLFFVLIDASKGGTNAYQSAYTVTLFVIAMILTAHSMITCAILIRYRYLKRRERMLMHDVAAMYADKHHTDDQHVVLPDNPREARLALASHQYPSEVKYLSEGTMVKVVDIPMKLLLEDDDVEMAHVGSDADEPHEDGVAPSSPSMSPVININAIRAPMRLVDRMSQLSAVNEAGIHATQSEYRTSESRNFWRVAAMESLTGEPIADIPYDPDAEDL